MALRHSLIALFCFLALPIVSIAQSRDFRAERLVLDDDGGGGTTNTITIQTPSTLSQTATLTIPQPTGATGQFLISNPAAGSAAAWLATGNAGTAAGTNFVGTTDNQGLYLQVRNGASVSNSLILNSNTSLQRDAGGNTRGGAAVDMQIARTDDAHVASGDYSVVAGGQRNAATGFSSTVSGGEANLASGMRSTVGGGDIDTASGRNATVSGGGNNVASGDYSTVAGGVNNRAEGTRATVGGGRSNIATGNFSVIPGGHALTVSGSGSFGFLGGNASIPPSFPMSVASSDVAVLGNVDLWLANNNSTASELRFYEANGTTGAFPPAGVNYSAFQAGAQTADITYVLPTAAGAAGQVLEIASVGTTVNLAWATDDNSSDLRFKRDVRPIEGALEGVLKLQGVRHSWRVEEFPERRFKDGEELGFIAQEVEKIFPELVETESDGYKKIHYGKVAAVLVEALKEQQAELDAQRDEIERLKKMVEQLAGMPKDDREMRRVGNER